MPVLTKLSPTKQGRMALFFDDEFAFSVDLETLAQNGLQKDKVFTTAELSQLFHDSQYLKAKNKAFKLLGYKSYTRYLLKERLLQEDFSPAVVDDVLDRLLELDFLDDLDYACRCAADLMNLKKYSQSRVKQELRRRGVSDCDIEEALAQMEDDPMVRIRQVIEKKYSRDLSSEKGRRRAVNGLVRLGYSYSQINQALNDFNIEIETENIYED